MKTLIKGMIIPALLISHIVIKWMIAGQFSSEPQKAMQEQEIGVNAMVHQIQSEPPEKKESQQKEEEITASIK